MTTQTDAARSVDGTLIGWSRKGDGAPIVMVGAVMASRQRTPQPALPAALAEHYTVFTYDRRGTGDSPETSTYAPEREFEDLQAVLELAGPEASVYGFSSGATLALLAAAHGAPIARLLLLEPPLIADPDLSQREEARRRLGLDRAAARRWFDEEVVGIPAEVRAQFPAFTEADLANAPAMLHELTFLPGTTANQFSNLKVPTLLMASDHTSPNLLTRLHELGAAIPHAVVRVLPGQWHGLADDVIVGTIGDFLTGATEHSTAPKERK